MPFPGFPGAKRHPESGIEHTDRTWRPPDATTDLARRRRAPVETWPRRRTPSRRRDVVELVAVFVIGTELRGIDHPYDGGFVAGTTTGSPATPLVPLTQECGWDSGTQGCPRGAPVCCQDNSARRRHSAARSASNCVRRSSSSAERLRRVSGTPGTRPPCSTWWTARSACRGRGAPMSYGRAGTGVCSCGPTVRGKGLRSARAGGRGAHRRRPGPGGGPQRPRRGAGNARATTTTTTYPHPAPGDGAPERPRQMVAVSITKR